MDSNSIALFYEDYSLYWYGIVIGFAIFSGVVCSAVMRYIQKESVNDILFISLPSIPLGLVGAKAYYCWHGPDGEISLSALFSVSKYLEGGAALYGALGAGLVVALIYCLITKTKISKLFDCIAPGLALGIGIGRLASSFSTTDRGEAVTSEAFQKAPFATWNEEGGEWLLNVYFFESMAAFAIFAVLTVMFVKRYKQAQTVFGTGDVALAFMFMYGLSQCWMEPMRSDALYWKSNIVTKLHFVLISQAMSALIAGIALAALILRYTYKYGINMYAVFTVVASALCFAFLFADELRFTGSYESVTKAMTGESALVLTVMGFWLIDAVNRFEGVPKYASLLPAKYMAKNE